MWWVQGRTWDVVEFYSRKLLKCKHWTRTPTRPNAFRTNRVLSWPLPTKRCKRKGRLLGAENRWVSTSSANPSSPFCELVAIWTKGGEWEKLILLTKLEAFTSNYLSWCMPPKPISNEMLKRAAPVTKIRTRAYRVKSVRHLPTL